MGIKINKEKCIGCGTCASICPDSFELKNGKASVKKSSGAPCEKQAEAACPVHAISIS